MVIQVDAHERPPMEKLANLVCVCDTVREELFNKKKGRRERESEDRVSSLQRRKKRCSARVLQRCFL